MSYQPKHMSEDQNKRTKAQGANIAGVPTDNVDSIPPQTAHPLGIPVPDAQSEAEYIPIPGKGSIDHLAPNGAIVRNPWSEQKEITPDNEYTEEKEDLNLLIM